MDIHKLKFFGLVTALMVVSAVFAGCTPEETEEKPAPYVPGPFDQGGEYEYLVNSTTFPQIGASTEFVDYVKKLYNSTNSADRELFMKLAEIGRPENRTVAAQLEAPINKIPEWKSNPAYTRKDDGLVEASPEEGNPFVESVSDLIDRHREGLLGDLPAPDCNTPTMTEERKQVSNEIKNDVIINFFKSNPKAKDFPFNANYVADKFQNMNCFFANCGSAQGGNVMHIATYGLDKQYIARDIAHEGIGHGLGGGEPVATFYEGFIAGNQGLTDKIFPMGTPSYESAFFWSLVKGGMPIKDLLEAFYTSNQAVDDVCDKYLMMEDGFPLCDFKEVRRVVKLFHIASMPSESKYEQVKGELQKFSQLGFAGNSLSFDQFINAFLLVFDPNDGHQYPPYKPPCDNKEEAIEAVREFLIISGEICNKHNILPMDIIHDSKIKGNTEIDYAKTKENIDKLYKMIEPKD